AEANKQSFYEVVLLQSAVNQGVAFNCDRAWRACSGEWVKTIAADDMLMPNCIEDNIIYAEVNPEAVAIFSDCIGFIDDITCGDHLRSDSTFYSLDANGQFDWLLKECKVFAPSSFLK